MTEIRGGDEIKGRGISPEGGGQRQCGGLRHKPTHSAQRSNERVGRSESYLDPLAPSARRTAATVPARRADTHSGQVRPRAARGSPRPARSRRSNRHSRERREGQGAAPWQRSAGHRTLSVLLLIVVINRVAVNKSESEERRHSTFRCAHPAVPSGHPLPRPSLRRTLPLRPQDSVDWRSASRRNRGGDTRKRAKGGRRSVSGLLDIAIS